MQFKRFGFHKPAAIIGLAALAPMLFINYWYHTWLTQALGVEAPSLAEQFLEAGLGQAGLIFFVCVSPGILEEIAFRGLVQHWLQVALKPLWALALASALFAAMHITMPLQITALRFPYLFAVGMLLGWTKWKTGSLYPAMLIHFAHNFAVVRFFD